MLFLRLLSLLSESLRFFDCIVQLLDELIVAFVRRQVWNDANFVLYLKVWSKWLFFIVLPSLLKQVWDRGSQVSFPTFSMQNRWGPLEPWEGNCFVKNEILQHLWIVSPISSAKPPTGTRHVPVTNCNSLARFSLSVSLTNWNFEAVNFVFSLLSERQMCSNSPARTKAPACYFCCNDGK